MIEQSWPKIAGLRVRADGAMSAVWLAHDKDNDVLHLYECCTFQRDVLAVVAEGMKKRGDWIPVAWRKEDAEIIEGLLNRGVNTIPEPVRETDTVAELLSREIEERMRTERFKVSRHLTSWVDEFKSFHRRDSKIPMETHPLMAATRYAVADLSYARRPSARNTTNYPKMAIV